MKKTFKNLATLSLAVGLLANVALADSNFIRVAGENRYETSAEVSKDTYEKSDNVILASGETFADALAGGQLSIGLDAPILLTSKGGLTEDVKAEISRLEAKNIYILGGENTISKEVEESLKDLKVIRLAGDTRYETSKVIMEETAKLGEYKNLVLVSGSNYPDALVSANYLVKNDALLLLSDGSSLPETDMEIVAIGGESSLKLEGFEGKRIAGETRYETSSKLVEETYPEAENLVLVSGETYPDALAAVSYVNKEQAPLVLVSKDSVPEASKEMVEAAKGIKVVGGVNTIADTVLVTQVEDLEDKLISAEDLKDMLVDDSVKVLDIRSKEDYEKGHIEGALNINAADFDDPTSSGVSELATKDQFEATMSSLGILPTDTLVVYAGTPHNATRVLWSLKAYGHENAYMLDGHLGAWEAGEGSLATGEMKPVEKSTYEAKDTDSSVLVDKAYVKEVVDGSKEAVLLDCRKEEEYKATEPANKANARGGFIPGAVNVPHTNALDENGMLKDAETLKAMYEKVGITEDTEVIAYCQSGYRATFTWFVLSEVLGYENVSVYDGSYVEWSNDAELEVEFVK